MLSAAAIATAALQRASSSVATTTSIAVAFASNNCSDSDTVRFTGHEELQARFGQVKAYLGLDDAQKELREALKVVEPFAERDAIESAHNRVRSVDDEAYLYSGLAFGITLSSLASSQWHSRSRYARMESALRTAGRVGGSRPHWELYFRR